MFINLVRSYVCSWNFKLVNFRVSYIFYVKKLNHTFQTFHMKLSFWISRTNKNLNQINKHLGVGGVQKPNRTIYRDFFGFYIYNGPVRSGLRYCEFLPLKNRTGLDISIFKKKLKHIYIFIFITQVPNPKFLNYLSYTATPK